VIRSKAGVSVDELGDQFCLLGPYNEACVRTEVEIMEPNDDIYTPIIASMKDAGVKVRTKYLIKMFSYPRHNLSGIAS